jgi:hypothetical protein
VLCALTLATLSASCSSRIGGDMPAAQDPGVPTDENGVPISGPGSPTATNGPGATPMGGPASEDGAPVMRRLTRFEYDNTLRDLLGVETNAAREFPPEERVLGYDNNARALMFPSAFTEQALAKAEQLAPVAVADRTRFTTCAAEDISEACAREFIIGFGTRALRRPLDSTEIDSYLALHATGRDFHRGLELVVTSMLVSLPFFYILERADDSTPPEYVAASKLSYALWSSAPDVLLLEQAARGELTAPEELRRAAERMLEDERARGAVAHFHAAWLGLDGIGTANKDPSLFPGYSSELLPMLRESVELFLDEAAWRGAGFQDLFLANYSYADARLASYYELSASEAMTRVELPLARSAGVLTQPGVLSMLAGFQTTSPTRRGAFVRTRLMCDPPSPPPPDVDITPPPLVTVTTRRTQTEAHSSSPACRGCHELIDPIGFGLEAFDATGRHRSEENGAPVDESGVVAGSSIGAFVGPRALAEGLAGAPEVQRCFARQLFRYLAGRHEQPEDEPLLEELVTTLGAPGNTSGYRAPLLTVVTSERFIGPAY